MRRGFGRDVLGDCVAERRQIHTREQGFTDTEQHGREREMQRVDQTSA